MAPTTTSTSGHVAAGILAARVDLDETLTEVHLEPAEILHSLYREIGCHTVDVVRLTDNLDMWLDDFGLYEGGINRAATRIARRFGYVHQPYFGAVVFAGTDGRGNVTALTPEGIAALRLFTL